MKRWTLLFASFAVLLFAEPSIRVSEPSTKQHDPIQHLSGSHSLGSQIFEKIVSSGILKLNGTTVTQHLRVDGSLFAQSAHLQALNVIGEASLSDSIVFTASSIIGSLRAQGTTFQGLLTLGAQKATFSSSRISSINVRKDLSFKGKQIIELKQKTLVEGTITFESGKGEVHLYPGSQVLGSITGGSLIKRG